MDARELIKAMRRREAEYRFCTRGDLVAEHQGLEAELDHLTSTGWVPTSVADTSPLIDLAARIEALQADMDAATVPLRFRALDRLAWDQIRDEHPARDGHEEGFDMATFPGALVAACLIDPDLSPREVADLFDNANQGQRNDMFATVWDVNTEATAVPFSERASVVTRWRELNSTPPEPGANPEASS